MSKTQTFWAAVRPLIQLMTAKAEHFLVQEKRDAPVDVQVGEQLWTDAPQELRSRLWMALLQLPAFVLLLDSRQVRISSLMDQADHSLLSA